MIYPDLEIDRIRNTLYRYGLEARDVQTIVDSMSSEINETISSIISEAAAEAVMYAESAGITQFMDDIDIVPDGWMFFVRTKSGNTNYSTPRIANLPNLLKNAKVSSDGSRYRVIPIKNKPNKNMTSSFSVMADQQKIAEDARRSIGNAAGTRSAQASMIAQQIKQSVSGIIQSDKQSDAGITTEFRTASDKQNPDTSWVIPEKDRDMTQFLDQLNDRVRDNMQTSVASIISQYEQEYL